MNININKEIERLNRHYQVFISSTYEDLKEYRFSALQAILDAECLPLGMEMFPSGDEEQLSYIEKIIDKSDFYLILVGGRYGSRARGRKSFTEEEFDYAKNAGKKIIALVLDGEDFDKAFKSQSDDDKVSVIEFRKKVRSERIVNSFKNIDQLKFEVLKSIREASKEENAKLGLVQSKEVMRVIASFDELDENEKNQYFDALTHLQNLKTDKLAWSYIENFFEAIKQATHSLVYEGNANVHGAPLLNSLIGLQRFIEEVVYVPIRISIKETEISGSAVKVRTICDTSSNNHRRKKSYPLDNYEGLNYLFRQIMQGEEEDFWLCNDITRSLKNASFAKGSFTKTKHANMVTGKEEPPYNSTFCLPIYNIDTFDNDRPLIRGFLCLDSKEKNQFQHDSIKMVASSFCSFLYIFLALKSYFKRCPRELEKVIFGSESALNRAFQRVDRSARR